MPFQLNNTNCSPLVIDYDYEIIDKQLLAQYVGELLLGHHFHVIRILNNLAPQLPINPNASIDQVINKILMVEVEKRDGWLFQMISWIVLAKRNAGSKFHSNTPQSAPAQHGLDGLAIILNQDDTLKNIIISEDKCTTSPRGKITQQVFPEFRSIENREKDNALIGIISTLLGNLDSGKILDQVKNDIFDTKYRVYRIGITRQENHNTEEGRNSLFKDYDKYVKGETSDRRSAASIYFEDMRLWMNAFADEVVAYLNSKKSTDVQ
ncbi:MAG: hypothetical protein JSS64_09270 [Bacteroidetes bacterium]|nr:hypothetical protein [Bacteroidota bacterium]